MADPTPIPWGTIVAGGAAAVVSIAGSIAALLAFVVRLLRENAKLKSRTRRLVDDRRLARVELERRDLGAPSVPPPAPDFSDDSDVIDVRYGQDNPYFDQLRIDARPLVPYGSKAGLPLGAGQEDYAEDRKSREFRTPEAINRRGLLSEEVTPREIPRPPTVPRFDGDPPLPPYRKKLPSRKG